MRYGLRSSGCRAWVENDGRTRVYSVPYSDVANKLSGLTELNILSNRV